MKKNKPRTLVLLFNEKNQILLWKKKYWLGKWYWNGFWWKIESWETIEQAAIRELEEESWIIIQENNLELRAILKFNWLHNPSQNYDGIVYIAKYNENDFVETEEMIPQWWNIDEIPYEQMWEDDKYRFPLLLEWKLFEFQANFSDDTTMKDYEIEGKEGLFLDY